VPPFLKKPSTCILKLLIENCLLSKIISEEIIHILLPLRGRSKCAKVPDPHPLMIEKSILRTVLANYFEELAAPYFNV
jgi:hypothetical protein